jgi:hypothetical protein
MSIAETGRGIVDLDEAARQLAQAVHNAQVAYDCLNLGNLDGAHTSAITRTRTPRRMSCVPR